MLTNREIRPDTLVSHPEFGIGRIAGTGGLHGDIEIDFESNHGYAMNRESAIRELEPISKEGLAAMVFRDRDGTARMASVAPLRLLAATLVDINGRARVTEIKGALTREVVDPKEWDKWWTRVREALKDSAHFSYSSSGVGLNARSVNRVESASFEDLATPVVTPRKPTASPAERAFEWATWIIENDEGKTAPQSPMPTTLVAFIQTLSSDNLAAALRSIAREIEENVLASKRRWSKSSQAWLDALTAALNRWVALSDPPDIPVGEIVFLMMRLHEVTPRNKRKEIVSWLGRYASKCNDNTDVTVKAILTPPRPMLSGTQSLLTEMCVALDKTVRMAFWERLLGLGIKDVPAKTAEDLLGILEVGERAKVISSLLLTVRDVHAIQELGSLLMAEWNQAETDQHRSHLFEPIALSWLLHGQLRGDAVNVIIESLTPPDRDLQIIGDSRMSEWHSMVNSASRIEVEGISSSMNRRIEHLDLELGEARSRLEQKEKQVAFLQGELRSAGNRSALSISRNAIEVLGGSLQSLAASPVPPSKEIRDVVAKVTLALSTLGSEPFGEVGEVVAFEPGLHEAHPTPASGTSVRVTAPGIRYFRGVESPITIIRIQASTEGS